MKIVEWLKESPFATPWFDVLLFGVLLFEVLPFFFRARAARYGLTAASVGCQIALLVSNLYLGSSISETMLSLSVAALFSAASSLVEYRLFDRDGVTAACKIKAEQAERVARERAEEFVLPITENPPVPEPAKEGGDAE